MAEYESVYAAPCYSVVSVEDCGTYVVRRVIIDGELEEFIVPRQVNAQAPQIGSGILAAEAFGDDSNE